MPLVLTKRNPFKVDSDEFTKLNQALPKIVSDALGSAQGPLTSQEVDVWSSQSFTYEVTNYDVAIVIDAHNFQDRLDDLDKRRDKIMEEVRSFVPKLCTISVWIRLMPTSWGETIGTA